jgi:hypothetical protein
MRICALSTRRNAFGCSRSLGFLQQTFSFLLIVVVVFTVFAIGSHFHALCGFGVCLCSFSPDFLGFAFTARAARSALDFVLVHSLQRLTHAQEQHHQPPLRELCMVDQVRVDHVLKVSATVVG